MRLSILLFSSVSVLAACSASPANDTAWPDSQARHYDPPAGCKRTACNVDESRCRDAAQALCNDCEYQCSMVLIEDQVRCYEICGDICARSNKSVSECASTAKSCEATSPRNGICADGVADACIPAPSFASMLPSPVVGRKGACSDQEIDALIDGCFSTNATDTACKSFESGHPACQACLLGSTGAEPFWFPGEGAKSAWTNTGLCVALRGDVECGRAIFAADSCAERACAACAGEGRGQCVTNAYGASCADLAAAAKACVARIPADVRSDCLPPADPNGFDFPAWFKRMIAQVCGR